jgi:hypothetical protein
MRYQDVEGDRVSIISLSSISLLISISLCLFAVMSCGGERVVQNEDTTPQNVTPITPSLPPDESSVTGGGPQRLPIEDWREMIGEQRWRGYLPYVESVKLPDEIHAGERIKVELTLSTALKPDVMYGLKTLNPPRKILSGGGESPASDLWGLVLMVYFYDPYEPAEPVEQPVTFTVDLGPYSTTGVYKHLYVESAPTRELGGMPGQIVFYGDVPYIFDPEPVWQDYPLTILPAQ